ncbi:MAG: glycosyltransferase family 39 protein [Candidatus Sumerlaeaceae bacterium]
MNTRLRTFVPGLIIFLGALAVRLICLRDFREIPFFDHLIVDSKAYDAWGWRIAQGDLLGNRAFYQAPLYPYFVGSFYAVFGHHQVWLRVLQAVLGSIACVVLARATQLFFNRTAGIAAGIMLALYAPAAFFDCLIQKSALDVLLLSIALLLLARARARFRPGQLFALGVVMGLLTLTRENALLLTPVMAVWLASSFADIQPNPEPRWRWQRALMVLFGLAVILGPIYLRNAYYGARTGITTYNVGTSFYIGNSSRAEGGYVPIRDERGTTELEESDAVEVGEGDAGRRLTPDEVSRYWFHRSFADIGKDPRGWMRLLLRKFLLAFNYIEIVDTDDIYFYEQFSPLLRALNSFWNFGLLFPLSAAGTLLCWRQRRDFVVLLLLAATMVFSLTLFYVVARYRHALVPLLIPIAAAGLMEASRIYALFRADHKLTRTAHVVAAAVAFLLCFALSRIPFYTRDQQLGTSYFNAAGAAWKTGKAEMARHYFKLARESGRQGPATDLNYGALLTEMGDFPAALESFARAEKAGAEPALLAQNRGHLCLGTGDFAEAARQYEKAEQASTVTAELENARGVALMHLKKPAEARAAFRKSIELRPSYSFPYIHLLEMNSTSGEGGAQELLSEARANGADITLIRKALERMPATAPMLQPH